MCVDLTAIPLPLVSIIRIIRIEIFINVFILYVKREQSEATL